MEKARSNCILIADDDSDDQFMIRQAFKTLNFDIEIQTANNGVELLDYLNKRGKYENKMVPCPKVILLDLNMPIKDGRECLKEIRANSCFSKIPVVVYSTSNNPDDISYSYEQGASSYIVKPYSFKELVEVMDVFKKYWFSIVQTLGTPI
jgi:CheY-like chemotaxis protein